MAATCVRLTDHAGNDHDPSWLPDGQSLVFASDRDRGAGPLDLYRLWIADGAVERLTTFFNGYAFMPSVSPDGTGSRLSLPRFPWTVDSPTRCTCSNWPPA